MMRVISDDKTFNIPFDKFIFHRTKGDIFVWFTSTVREKIASYDNVETAQAMLDDMQKAYESGEKVFHL